ncbi:acyl-CoA dehydrogenase family protein [Streptomyces sp. TRM70350]|uniref:acyl-CoA dehydrogenase family protein n=1 Tax=Streptomyces sp. TRM70350 TaxID=2856165 RepID=UPI001C47D20C|nr:acyl-CoA dehydrogenase [Streptomyces sp. TRM70350]MBV7695703.1 acyl-CoA dehydrogenase [Streptomyces sp. TRM70350]
MPAFSLEPEQAAWCAELRTLAAERLRPLAEKGEPGHVNRLLVTELGRLGLLDRLFTSGALDLCLMRESLAYACTEAETALALQGLGAHPVHAHGTPEQRDRWLPGVREGSVVAAFALSEPGAGSDAAALSLRAEPEEAVAGGPPDDDARDARSACSSAEAGGPARGGGSVGEPGRPARGGASGVGVGGLPRGAASGGEPGALPPGGASGGGAGDLPRGAASVGGSGGVGPRAAAVAQPRVPPPGASLAAEADGSRRWRLSGEKCWISNAPEADFYTVFARTTPDAGARGVTAFLVPADRPGLTGTGLDMLSPHPIGTLHFDAVPVTADDVLGEVDRGFRVAMGTLNLFRPSVGAFAVGMAQAALDASLAHTARRDAFGGKLRDLQAVAHQVAEMAVRTEAARLMVYAAATAYDEGADGVPKRAAMAKLLATETAQYVVDRAVQLHGARALRRGHLLEHLYREVRAPRVYEGASEVQRGIIAKELYATPEARP